MKGIMYSVEASKYRIYNIQKNIVNIQYSFGSNGEIWARSLN